MGPAPPSGRVARRAPRRRLELGIVLPVEGVAVSRRAVLAAARDAEALGFHSVWTTDRLLKPARQPSGYPYGERRGSIAFAPDRIWLEPVTVMAAVAAVTDRILIGTNVLVLPYRQPVVLAQELATVDRLSEGRTVLGVGVGWMSEEFAALGLDRARRGATADDYIDLLRRLWGAAAATPAGDQFTALGDMTLGAPPLSAGGPPIFIGGNSPAALRRAALRGDGWLGTHLEPEETAAFVAALHEACAAAGRDPYQLTVGIKHRIEPATDSATTDTIASAAGGAQRVAELLDRYHQAGADLVVLDLLSMPDSHAAMSWVATDVMPLLAEAL